MAKYRCRVEPHGPHQLELKIRYPVRAEERSQYSFDLYIFLPAQLRVRDAYGSRRFIDDVISHIRHTSPRISLDRLVDPGFAGSPLARVKAELARVREGTGPDEEGLLRELRTLGNAFRSAVRTERSLILRRAAAGAGEDLDAKVRSVLADLARLLEEVRCLAALFGQAGLAERLQVGVQWADEWVSLNAEVELIRVWEALRAAGTPRDLLDAVRARIRDETAHRRKAGYASVVRPGDAAANEKAIYHESMLKKWSQGALYMSSEQLATSRGIGHIIGGVAAAVAMSFAVFATFLTTQLFAMYSVPWALMIVVGYIFKDRMKEMLKGSLNRIFPLLFFDRSGRLTDRAVEGPVGSTRETVRHIVPSDCPQDAAALRYADGNPFREILPRDDVIHYNKIVKLRSSRLRTGHGDLDSITEILRMKVDPWMREMDDPTSRLRLLWGNSVATVVARRVYHVHLVLALSSSGEERSLHHYLAILSRDGVQRVETLGGSRGQARAGKPRLDNPASYESASSSLE